MLWAYIWETANCAGIWEPNLAEAALIAGVPINENEIKKTFGKYILVLPDGAWYIKNFIEFQYGTKIENMNPESMVHAAVMRTAKGRGIDRGRALGMLTLSITAPKPNHNRPKTEPKPIITAPPEPEKPQPELPNIPPPAPQGVYQGTINNFNEIWELYPRKVGKREAWTHFKAQCRTVADWTAIKLALQNYIKSERVRNGYIQDGSTWFNNWKDWIQNPEEHPAKKKPDDDFAPIICSKCKKKFVIPKEMAEEIKAEQREFICRNCRIKKEREND